MTKYMLTGARRPHGDAAADLRGRRQVQPEGQGRGHLGLRRRPGADRRLHDGGQHRRPSRSSPTGRSPRPRSGSGASGSSTCPTWTPRLSGPSRGLQGLRGQGRGPPVPGRHLSRVLHRRDRLAAGDRADLPRGVRPDRRLPGPPLRQTSTSPRRRPAEALLAAVEKWPVDGVPAQPRRLADHDGRQPRHRQDPPRVPPRRQAPGGTDDQRRHTARADRPASRTTGCG